MFERNKYFCGIIHAKRKIFIEDILGMGKIIHPEGNCRERRKNI